MQFVDISNTTYLPRLVNVVKGRPLRFHCLCHLGTLQAKLNKLSHLYFYQFQKKHGAQNLSINRHEGDIGNILTPSNRVTDLNFFEMYRPYLIEENGIIGKAFVVHANYLGNFEKK